MLPKPDYGHFHKFIVSVGLFLIIVALLAPWAALQMSMSVAGSSDNVQTSNPTPTPSGLSRDQRQRDTIANLALDAWPWISAGAGLLGITSAGYGLLQWRRRDAVLFEREGYERDLARAQVASMSSTEIEEKVRAEAEKEADSVEGAPRHEADPSRQERARNQIFRAETTVIALLQEGFKHTHIGRPHLRMRELKGTSTFDLLLEGRDEAYEDVGVEIKYLRGPVQLPTYALQLTAACEAYSQITNRAVHPLLVVVIAAPQREQDYDRRERDARRRLEQAQASLKQGFDFIFLREAILDDLDAARLRVQLPEHLGIRRTPTLRAGPTG